MRLGSVAVVPTWYLDRLESGFQEGFGYLPDSPTLPYQSPMIDQSLVAPIVGLRTVLDRAHPGNNRRELLPPLPDLPHLPKELP